MDRGKNVLRHDGCFGKIGINNLRGEMVSHPHQDIGLWSFAALTVCGKQEIGVASPLRGTHIAVSTVYYEQLRVCS
jgi:hypothetical protein